MKLLKIKLEVNGNEISFKNEYLKRCFVNRGQLAKRNKYGVKIMSQCHPQIDIEHDESDNPRISIYLYGSNDDPNYVWSGYKVDKNEIEYVVGAILMSLANFDMRNSTNDDGEDKVSELILNGVKHNIDIGKQVEIARFLLGDKL
jgi:hypothetical protein